MSEHHTEEFLAEERRVEAEIDKFLADDRTIRFETTDFNFTAMNEFLYQHGLEVNHRNLLFAYDSLQDTLELTEFKELIPASEPAPTPAPAPQTPSVVPVVGRTFVAYRNGQPISGSVRSL